MTVKELIEELEQYGDHLPVYICFEDRGKTIYANLIVYTEYVDGESSVTLTEDRELYA